MNIQAPVSQPNPRDIAADILAEHSREKRQAMLERCPDELRGIVQSYVEIAFGKAKAYRAHKQQRHADANVRPQAAPNRYKTLKPPQYTKSAPATGNTALASLRAILQGGQ